MFACTADEVACSDRSSSRASDFLSAPKETMREMPRAPALAASRANCALSRLSTAALDAGKDLGLRVRNRLDAGEELQMHRLDGGDDGDMRPHHFYQRLDLACMVHADLED